MSVKAPAQARPQDYAVDGIVPSEVVAPTSPEEVAECVRRAGDQRQAIIPWGGGTMMRLGGIPRAFDVALRTTEMDRVLEYEPADLVVTAQAGVRLAELQKVLGEHGQFLALDPPRPEQATIGGLIAANSSGPLRLRYGTCRDMLIGIKAVLADGSITKSGGKVVKNVTGYDMGKLYTGSLGTLGVIVEASFKVAPLPVVENTILAWFDHPKFAFEAARRVYGRALPILACDLLSPAAAAEILPKCEFTFDLDPGALDAYVLVIRAGGSGEPSLFRQNDDILALCSAPGGDVVTGESVWSQIQAFGWSEYETIAKISVRPSRTGELLARLPKEAVFISHALSGVTYVFGMEPEKLQPLVRALGGYLVLEACPLEVKQRMSMWGETGPDFKLMRRIKQEFDPNGMFNPGRYVGGL